MAKCCRKILITQLRRHLREMFKTLTDQKVIRVLERYFMPYYVQMLITIPPKFTVPQVIGLIKGKCAIHLAQVSGDWRRKTSLARASGHVAVSPRRSVGTSQ